MVACRSCGIAGPEKNSKSVTRNITPNINRSAREITVSHLKRNAVFQKAVSDMVKKYASLSEENIYDLIDLVNRKTYKFSNKERTGIFQLETKYLNKIGYTSSDIQSMSYVQQLAVYQQYLDYWHYVSGSLWIMHIAPEFANMPMSAEVYQKGSANWVRHSSMRDNEGKITIQSITDYHNRQLNLR